MNADGGFRSVIFDCDSTLVSVEGIDALAGDQAPAIAALTEAAMQGQLPLEGVYARRLELIRPTRAQVAALGEVYIAALVEDARETVAALLWLGVTVRILSGGLRPPVEALARALGLAPGAVDAVDVYFDARGAYAGFDTGSLLARAGGKAELLAARPLQRPALLVGDGATDREAAPAVEAFAAYFGVAERAGVAQGADFVLRAATLAPVLALAASGADRERLRASRWAALLAKGERLAFGAERPIVPGSSPVP